MISLIALALAAAQPAQQSSDQPAGPAMPQVNAHFVVAMLQPRLPQRFSPDLALVEAAAEDRDLVVLTFEVPVAMIEGQTPETISAQLSQGLCAAPHARAMLDGPLAMRPIARASTGQSIEGVVVERCPPAAG